MAQTGPSVAKGRGVRSRDVQIGGLGDGANVLKN